MPSSKRILDVGQCGFDGPRIGQLLTTEFNCTVDRAHSLKEALTLAASKAYDLVLVNRLLARDDSRGLDVIAALRVAHPRLQVMLVSNYEEAQEEAVKLGALKGFGKSDLDSEATVELLRSALGHS